MLRFAADENFNAGIVRGLLRRLPDLDIVRVQDVGLSGASDPAVLEWAAREGRIVLTHDVSTLVALAAERVTAHLPMPGVFAARSRTPIGSTIDDLALLAECSVDVSGKVRSAFCRFDATSGKLKQGHERYLTQQTSTFEKRRHLFGIVTAQLAHGKTVVDQHLGTTRPITLSWIVVSRRPRERAVHVVVVSMPPFP